MLKKFFVAALSAAVLMTGALATDAIAAKFATIGTGGITGVYYPTGGAIAKIINAKKAEYNIRASVESTGGSKFNINAINKGDLEFGIAQADTQYMAVKGLGDWEGKPVSKLRFVFALAPEAVTFIAAEDSGIKSVADVKGKTINLGDPGSGNRVNAMQVFKEIGLKPGDDFRGEGLKPADAPHTLQDGRLDGFFYTVGHPNGNNKEATAGKRKCRIVPITGLDNLLKECPYYSMTKIDMKQYPDATNAADGTVETLGMLATFVTSADVDADVVYAITKEVVENLEEFKKLHPALGAITKESLLEGRTAPLHPGAEKYFKEAGLIK
jgi:TRAP transporter TAXI family solute receptor